MIARRVDGLVIERTDDELLVLRKEANEAHALNEAAAIIFDLCDGVMTRNQMADEVARRTSLPVDESIIDLALTELVDAGLVVVEDVARPGITRRSIIRRLALPVAAVALLPVVETILMPAASAGEPLPPPPTTMSPATKPPSPPPTT